MGVEQNSDVASYYYPGDREACLLFVKNNIGTDSSLNVEGIVFSLQPSRGDDIIWFTNGYGVDSCVDYLDKDGNVCPVCLFEQIWAVAKYESEPRDERGSLLY